MLTNRKRPEVSSKGIIDETLLRDMIEIDTLQTLLESFSQISGVGAGIFAPDGSRIGNLSHHSQFCSLLYTTPKGREACVRCDSSKIRELMHKGGRSATEPYMCHAGLIEFCVPISCRVARRHRIIGVLFAGQILYDDQHVGEQLVRDIKRIGRECDLDSDELLATYMRIPRISRKRIGEIRQWMRQFADSIGLLVGRKAATQQLLLDVIGSADDPNAIVKAIQRHLQPAAVSIFLRRDGAPDKFRDRIFLSATTFKPLASRLSVEGEDIKRMSYSAGEGLTGWVYKTGKVLHISDVLDKDSYPRYPYFPKWNHKIKEINNWVEMRAFLGVPIRSDNRVIGVIRAARLKKDPGFRNDEVELLTGIASIVGAAASKARLYKEHGEKIRALKQAQDLLEKLTEPGTSLDSITKNMVGQLGHTYVTKGKWEAVYVVQHLKSSKQFRIVAYFPSDLADKYRRSPFLDTEGVVGHVLKTGKFSASKNFIRDGVKPTTPWTSVICAPIFHKGEMWGAVDLCGNNLSQTDVDLASPRITRFAENMSIVCRLSEMLDAKNAVTLLASNVLSLNLEAHEVYKSLESSKITVDHLCTQVEGEEKRIAEDLAKQIDDSLSWADVCLDLGRYIRLCQTKPDTAIEAFRDKHLLRKNGEKQDNVIEHPWEEISITEVAKRALSNMQLQVDTLKTDMRPRIMDGGIIVGDENLLYRAFRNLLENAMVHGSKIPGKLGRFKKGLKVFFSIKRDNNTGTTKIVIQDRGVGMNPMILAASKEIYANPTLLGRTSFAPGFGTTIVAFALSVHHGCILLESRHGKGTKVTIEIPSCKKRDKPNEKDNYHR